MPRPSRHWLDYLADELFEWIEEEIDALVFAFQAGGRSPFAAPVSEKQKIQFYDRAFFLPSGEPNQAGRKATMARIGPDEYVRTLRAVMKYRQTGLPDETEEAPAFPESAVGAPT